MRLLALLALSLPSSALAATYYADSDGDTYGDPDVSVSATSAPSGYVSNSSDCDDTSAAISPADTEACNGYDDDCDGSMDEGGVCPCDVEEYDGKAYMFCTSAKSWTNAQAYCETYGEYELSTISSAAEDAWINTEADSRSTAKWWFGFNDRTTEGTFAWSDGSEVLYTNWHSGEPNDSGGNEDCTQHNRFTDGTWNDEPCTSSFYFI